jgi:hypothetical protein
MTTTTTAVATPVSADERAVLMARIAQLEAKVSAKAVNDGSDIKLTVPRVADEAKKITASEGGSLSMYGVNARFPITLTFTQWVIVAKKLPKLFLFASANYGKLFFKTDEQSDNAAEFLKSIK